MKRFLFGMLAGVVLAAIVALFGFRGVADYWKHEIYLRGGGAYTFDPAGKLGWKWLVQPIK